MRSFSFAIVQVRGPVRLHPPRRSPSATKTKKKYGAPRVPPAEKSSRTIGPRGPPRGEKLENCSVLRWRRLFSTWAFPGGPRGGLRMSQNRVIFIRSCASAGQAQKRVTRGPQKLALDRRARRKKRLALRASLNVSC